MWLFYFSAGAGFGHRWAWMNAISRLVERRTKYQGLIDD
jgi:hypothetical protein